MKKIEKVNSGVRFQGNWHEIVLFSHVLAHFLEDTVSYEEAEGFKEWMPEEEEDETDMREKTACGASIRPTKIEEEFNGVKEEIKDVEHKVADSVHDIANKKSPTKDLSQATKDIERLVASESIKSLRKMERMIYKHIMLKFNPYYFDTEDFSVNLECKDKDRYKMTVNISDEYLRTKVQERFKS
ncbi:MAG: DUF5828 family protein [Thermoplasmatota archaeon]